MSAAPLVSVGLPVYNGERYLETTLADLLGQSFEAFEVVACDNASTDATPDILADAARRDPRVRVVRNARNLGALPNANLAYRRSRAPLYVLSSYDDRHAPDFLARLVDALEAAPGAGLAYGRSTLIDADDRPLAFDEARRVYRSPSGEAFDYDARLERPLATGPVGRYRSVLRSNDVNAPIHGLFRRSVLDRVGPHQPHGSDRLVVAHAALLAPFAFVDAPLFGFRIHPASTYHLTRSEWMARESGVEGAGSPLDGLHTLRAYLSAVGRSPLGPPRRGAATLETLRYAARPAVLRRLLLPSPDHYFGWTGTASIPTVTSLSADRGVDQERSEWRWMSESNMHRT